MEFKNMQTIESDLVDFKLYIKKRIYPLNSIRFNELFILNLIFQFCLSIDY